MILQLAAELQHEIALTNQHAGTGVVQAGRRNRQLGGGKRALQVVQQFVGDLQLQGLVTDDCLLYTSRCV